MPESRQTDQQHRANAKYCGWLRCVLTLLDLSSNSLYVPLLLNWGRNLPLMSALQKDAYKAVFSGRLPLQEFELSHHGALLDEGFSAHGTLSSFTVPVCYSCIVWTHLALSLQFKHFCAPLLVTNFTCISFHFLLVNLTESSDEVPCTARTLCCLEIFSATQPSPLPLDLASPQFSGHSRMKPDSLSECHSNGLWSKFWYKASPSSPWKPCKQARSLLFTCYLPHTHQNKPLASVYSSIGPL